MNDDYLAMLKQSPEPARTVAYNAIDDVKVAVEILLDLPSAFGQPTAADVVALAASMATARAAAEARLDQEKFAVDASRDAAEARLVQEEIAYAIRRLAEAIEPHRLTLAEIRDRLLRLGPKSS